MVKDSEPSAQRAAAPAAVAENAPEEPGLLLRLIKDQRIAFLLVGGLNTAIGTAWFIFFELLFGEDAGRFGYMISLACAHVASVITAFLLNRFLVFRVQGHFWLDLFRFWLVNLTTLGINAVSLPAVVELTGMRPIYAQLLITAATAFISFFGHKYFSFHRKKAVSDAVAQSLSDLQEP